MTPQELDKDPAEMTDQDWRELLDDNAYRITRQAGTEPAFSGQYWDTKTDGVYQCVCCGADLFDSETKYESGSGWPSFWEPLEDAPVEQREDRSHGMTRTEVVCGRCDAHLGHVFDDGPQPSGERYCINSAALEFVERG